ncbi:MAG: methylated-DNA--[protein]-cysteine S-methyltransferase [Bacteroidia bacterium]|nr:methylated-DNA--[protein]-cysteine S-methyltransferase [Bacteroidia bacterium]
MSTTLYIDFLRSSPLGELTITCSSKGVQKIEWGITESERKPNQLTQKTISQLTAFFKGKQHEFDLVLDPEGTDFQQEVWAELTNIPYGKTISYEELATRLGDEKVIRAAASANGKNPIPIVIPCHRVIGKDGSLTGFSGGLWRKKKLLELEQGWTQQKLF